MRPGDFPILAVWPYSRRKRIRDNLIVVAWAILVFVFLCFVLVTSAIAHSFYSPECCSDRDCAPIDASRVRPAFAGYMVDGVHYVPMGQVKHSPDGQFHACFPKPDTLRCLYAPPNGS